MKKKRTPQKNDDADAPTIEEWVEMQRFGTFEGTCTFDFGKAQRHYFLLLFAILSVREANSDGEDYDESVDLESIHKFKFSIGDQYDCASSHLVLTA